MKLDPFPLNPQVFLTLDVSVCHLLQRPFSYPRLMFSHWNKDGSCALSPRTANLYPTSLLSIVFPSTVGFSKAGKQNQITFVLWHCFLKPSPEADQDVGVIRAPPRLGQWGTSSGKLCPVTGLMVSCAAETVHHHTGPRGRIVWLQWLSKTY